MNEITTQQEYEDLIRSVNPGFYPRVLTTDGKIFGEEFRHNFDQWRADHTIIADVKSGADWPSFRQATKMRLVIRRDGCRCEECTGKWL